jgi:hypothetical protein
MRKHLVDPKGVRSITAMAIECSVPGRWLRKRVIGGEVACVRIGFNFFIPISETQKIKKLAARRTERIAAVSSVR